MTVLIKAGRKTNVPSKAEARATLLSRPKSWVALKPDDRNTRKPATITSVVNTIARPEVRSVRFMERV